MMSGKVCVFVGACGSFALVLCPVVLASHPEHFQAFVPCVWFCLILVLFL